METTPFISLCLTLSFITNILFPGILSIVAQVPENWTKGKLLGAGAFGQVRCKLT